MTDPVATLLDLLDIEPLELNLYRGKGSGGETSKRIFGGQVVGQALSAAYHTVEGRSCHSLHAYFMRPGDPSRPVIYEVDRARDGGSFTTRRVIAIQNGKQILNMAASFHVDEPGLHHQHDMPTATDPETLPTRAEAKAKMAARAPEARRADILRPSPIELRPTDDYDPLTPNPSPDGHSVWFRLTRPVPDAPAWMQHCLLTYASDLHLMGTGLRPHGKSIFTGEMMIASLDHAIWFHAPVDFGNWHLYVMDSPWTGAGRGVNRGLIYAADGTLVASTAQEGLMRPVTPG
ncbi:acyl-CoA thioesterase II [Roseobacter sp. HKCCD9010]|uniref:acyl-CoA thioesterase n=1 Tax=unclassified Roseobacter TaxID=196798 RepID=UPI00149090AB|nr:MULTISPECIES: acyl-CoA thioesterase II [unclassified Roseobacter]MBF9049438.1 acyl-CoA thioesterase II [Rhodobacterales bacterium HKCCD4356]NNV11438.1 acyl-CoA thioesterase II [Roseobacter sp. HKCCD7357]NNV15622.1 acyl-CoA thioesterase II [Roseobacter sp. HKCCD8768]NNV25082.1 acyl-CoA thioesterase II [Roseobacter sp. HKCCD8192]NNV29339.1 acyl-CoA thioesterase II [Roseobacter sp. HKCCD9061]